ncbi:MAG: DNA repair protein RecN [Bacteroidaceae bacterium]|nr:DNA repair protein RecN [Bacteroidaceae bacterium]
MIKNLHIENYALIELLDIDLHTGFSVMTGETGAGKSIIIGAIGLLLGQRADSKALKVGAKRCVVEATFDVTDEQVEFFFAENDLDFDGSECIIRRELTATGKSRAFINDTPASLTQLKELGERLIDIHSQHKNLLLGKEDFQLNTLDILAKNGDLLVAYQKEYRTYQKLEKQFEEALEEAKNGKEDEDYLRFQVEQLEDANLKEGEQETLEEESEMLEHAEEIKSSLYRAVNGLQTESDGMDALRLLKQSLTELRSIVSIYGSAKELAERLDSCYIELKDIAKELEGQAEEVEYNPQRLEEVNDRLNTIYTLQKKHSVETVKDLLVLQEELEEKLLRIDNSDAFIEELRQKVASQRDKAMGLAKQLSKTRQVAARDMEKVMVEKLLPLGMPNVQFKCSVIAQPTELTTTGCDIVQFLFNANKSGELQPVSQIASGGEIARVMLALKSLIAGKVKLPTIIFDEIDTGVSGSIAEKMAKMMQEMGSQKRQVISITHLPQIAALGNYHYKVYKEDTSDTTRTHIILLTDVQKVEEIAHMLSGETLTQAALENAKSLLKQQVKS